MILRIDDTYHWHGNSSSEEGVISQCRIRIFQPFPEANKIVVLLSDQDLKIGHSVTNSIEQIAPKIVEKFNLLRDDVF